MGVAMVFVSVVLTGTECAAHKGELIYPIYQIPKESIPDLHDGTIEDWEDVLPGPSLTTFDFGSVEVAGAQPLSPEDLACQIFMGWSLEEQRIYIAIERFDDFHVNTYDGTGLSKFWQSDGAELMIDGDHSGGQYSGFGGDRDAAYRLMDNQAQHYYMLPSAPDSRLLLSDNERQLWSIGPPWIEIGGWESGTQPSLATMEAAVTPWDELRWDSPDLSEPSRLDAGMIIGFQIALPDFDDFPKGYSGDPSYNGEYSGYYTVEGHVPLFQDASEFSDGLLVGYANGSWAVPTDVSSVAKVGWARIKDVARLSAKPWAK